MTTYACPKCQSKNVLISACITINVRPNTASNEEEETIDTSNATWEQESDAWCEDCGWNGLVKHLKRIEVKE
jgi:DNA-directed RNA polymerase subunit RPC12/RpoP